MYVPLLVLLKSTLIYYDILQFGSIKFFIEFALDDSNSFPCPGVTPTEWPSKICLQVIDPHVLSCACQS
jgi:hypothetical protein